LAEYREGEGCVSRKTRSKIAVWHNIRMDRADEKGVRRHTIPPCRLFVDHGIEGDANTCKYIGRLLPKAHLLQSQRGELIQYLAPGLFDT
jgi:hypothetical protein